jgi:hypothetical protein
MRTHSTRISGLIISHKNRMAAAHAICALTGWPLSVGMGVYAVPYRQRGICVRLFIATWRSCYFPADPPTPLMDSW